MAQAESLIHGYNPSVYEGRQNSSGAARYYELQTLRDMDPSVVSIRYETALPWHSLIEQQSLRESVLQSLSKKDRKEIEAMTKAYQSAPFLVVNAVGNGLGDAIQAAAFAPELAEHSQKPVYCVLPDVLLGVFDEYPGVSYVQQENIPVNRQSFWIKGGIQVTDIPVTGVLFDCSCESVVAFRNAWYEMIRGTIHNQKEDYWTTTYMHVGLAAIGHFAGNTPNHGLFDFTQGMPPQETDVTMVLDAKEGVDSKSTRFREPGTTNGLVSDSIKFVPEELAKDMFRFFPIGIGRKRLSIVLGTNHPEYCRSIYSIAQATLPNNWDVSLFRGSLRDVAKQFARSKLVFGVDTGIMHLANAVAIDAHENGRTIRLVQVFNENYAKYNRYGLRWLPSGQVHALVVKGRNDYPDSLRFLHGNELLRLIGEVE
jgi:hypothetical protein